jgi:putative serine protease PepD
MTNSFRKYLWLVLIILIVYIFINRDDASHVLQPNTAYKSLEPNEATAQTALRPVVISEDEEININVFEKVHPAVVNIAATTLEVNFWMEIIPREGQGTGFIIDKGGYILTNNHVVADAQKITVTMVDGRKIPASLIGRDPISDLAVIKIPQASINVIAPLGDSDDIRVGQKAIAIGNPFGLGHTLTTGIVSAINRSIKTDEYTTIDNLIQTDAAINPGNSGGPLLNSNGEVVGINTVILSLSGGYQGIGFAIPINEAKDIASQLIATGRVARPWLGISGIDVFEELAVELGLGVKTGVLVVETLRGGSADQAGIKGGSRAVIIGGMRLLIGGDIITKIDGHSVSGMNELGRILDKMKPGKTIPVEIYRNHSPMELRVILEERPS